MCIKFTECYRNFAIQFYENVTFRYNKYMVTSQNKFKVNELYKKKKEKKMQRNSQIAIYICTWSIRDVYTVIFFDCRLRVIYSSRRERIAINSAIVMMHLPFPRINLDIRHRLCFFVYLIWFFTWVLNFNSTKKNLLTIRTQYIYIFFLLLFYFLIIHIYKCIDKNKILRLSLSLYFIKFLKIILYTMLMVKLIFPRI